MLINLLMCVGSADRAGRSRPAIHSLFTIAEGRWECVGERAVDVGGAGHVVRAATMPSAV